MRLAPAGTGGIPVGRVPRALAFGEGRSRPGAAENISAVSISSMSSRICRGGHIVDVPQEHDDHANFELYRCRQGGYSARE